MTSSTTPSSVPDAARWLALKRAPASGNDKGANTANDNDRAPTIDITWIARITFNAARDRPTSTCLPPQQLKARGPPQLALAW